MKYFPIGFVILSIIFLVSCGNGGMTMPANDFDSAEGTLISFFDALSRNDFDEASKVHLAPNPLTFLYEDIDPQDAEALLSRACTPSEESWCVFYCWKIKDVVCREQVSSEEFVFRVRFEDEAGNLLTGGDNVTPQVCGPTGCIQEEFTYHVVKIDRKFYVDGIPVFAGCWP
jgi:hypothetical protein